MKNKEILNFTQNTACNVMDLDLPERSLAFLLYIIKIGDKINVETSEIQFVPIKERFGRGEARWATAFYASKEDFIEYWIIYIDDEPMAVAQRTTNGDQIGISFSQLVMMPIYSNGIALLIEKLPQVSSSVLDCLNMKKH